MEISTAKAQPILGSSAYSLVTCAAVALAFAVTSPAISSGLLLDDHMQELYFRIGQLGGASHFWNLFDVCGRGGPPEIAQRIAAGALPWWALPDLSMALFRPLAALTHFVDYSLWPEHPAVMHLENCAWYALLVWLVARIYRSCLGRSWPAVLALFFFAVSEAHAGGTAWVAGRNTLMTAVATAGVLTLHDSSRRGGSRIAGYLAPVVLLLGFGSSEGAVATWAYLIPYALFLDSGTRRQSLLALLPFLVVTVGWQLFYRAAGYGVHGSAAYRDPAAAPWIFLTQQVPNIAPRAIRDLLVPSSTRVSHVPLDLQRVMLRALGLLAAVCLLLLVRVARHRREVAFWLSSFLLAVVPLCTIELAPRLFYVPSIAACALSGELVVVLARAAVASPRGPVRVAALALSALLFALHGPVALALAPREYRTLTDAEFMFQAAAAGMEHHAPPSVDTAFIVNTPNYFITALSPLYDKSGAWPPHMYILGSSEGPVRLSRPDETSILLEPRDGYLADASSRMVRAPEFRFARGETIPMGPMLVTVEETTIDGRPRRVRFRATELGRLRAVWLVWFGNHYEEISLPPVGAVRDFPASRA